METISTSKTGGYHFFRKKNHPSLCKLGSAQLIDLFLKIFVLQANFWRLGIWKKWYVLKKKWLLGNSDVRVVCGDLMFRIAGMCYLTNLFAPSPPPPAYWRTEFCPMTTPKLVLDIRLQKTSQSVRLNVVGAPCWLGTLPSVLLGVWNRKIFPSNLPKCLKWLRKALFMLCCCF